MFWMAALVAHAGADRESVSLGVAGMGAPGTGGGLGSAYFSLRVGGPVYFDLGAQEGLLAGPTRTVTSIHAAGRVLLGEHLSLRGGFVHQHETELDAFLADPVLVTLGAGSEIGHHTGGDLGIGLRGTMPGVHTAPLHPAIAASVTALAGSTGPHLYGVVESLLEFELGRPRS